MLLEEGISLIIPIKNTPFDILDECLGGVFSQTFDNYEVICIDDGSNNADTRNVIEKYYKKHKDMCLVRLEDSEGLGTARNIGMQIAHRKYITFFDSDDVMYPNHLLNLYTCIKKNNADVCVSGYVVFEIDEKNNKRKISTHRKKIDYHERSWNLLMKDGLSACNKLYKVDFLRRENIKFPEIKTDEDAFFNAMVLLCTDNIVCSGYSNDFWYRFNTEFQLSNDLNPFRLLKVIESVKENLKERHNFQEEYLELLDNYLVVTGAKELKNYSDKEIAKSYYHFFQKYLKGNNIAGSNSIIRAYINLWINNTYESGWIELVGDYDKQLLANEKQLMILLSKKKGIYIWGKGRRGCAFERFTSEHDIKVEGICDASINPECESDKYYKIYSTEYVIENAKVIIATTDEIYSIVKKIVMDRLDLINLELFCPL